MPAVGVALLDSPTQAVVVVGLYLIAQQIEINLLVPHLMRSQANIPPVLAIFALIAGNSLGGILGALIAIPLAGTLRVLTVLLVTPAIRAWIGSAVQQEGSADSS